MGKRLQAVRDIILVAAAYYITGRLGLAFAIPPGYASPVWPPSGVGLAALLILGRRCWPGIFLGSFILDATYYFDIKTDFLKPEFYTIPAIISIGSVLRGVVGQWLVRKYSDAVITLEKPRDIINLILLGGVVGCLIGASISCLGLLYSGVINHDNFAFRWYTWWIGDIVGVIVFTPALLLLFANKELVSNYRKLIVSGSLLFIFAIVVYGFVRILDYEMSKDRLHFEQKSEQLSVQIQHSLNDRLRLLESVKSFAEVTENITYEHFVRFTAPLVKDNYITGISWIPLVTRQERASFEQAMRKQGMKGFSIKYRTDDGSFKVSQEREEYFPITYSLPKEAQKKYEGFDIGSEPRRKEAISYSRNSGNAHMLAPVNLLAAQGVGLLLYLPVYDYVDYVEEFSASEQQQRNLRGFMATGFVVSNMLARMAEEAKSEHMKFSLFVSSPDHSSEELLFDSSAPAKGNEESPIYNDMDKSFSFAGSVLNIHFAQDPSLLLLGKHWTLWLVLGAEAVLLSLMSAFVLMVTGRIDVVQRLVAEKTEELRNAKERFQLVIDGTVDGIWDWPDSTKDEVYWSPKWKALLGYRDDEITGSKTMYRKLLHPDDVEPCSKAIQSCLEEDRPFDIEYRLRKKSGEYGWFHGKGVVTRSSGITRMTGSITDITERKFSETVRDRLIKQLTDVNEQLEQFAYVASHDLREPLRIIVSFIDLLIKEYGVQLGKDALEYMNITRQAAKKMEALVSDLLEYGRLGKEGERHVEIDCDIELMRVKEALGEAINSTGAIVQTESLPKIIGTPVRFSSLMQNLIGNALKYQLSGNAPRIRVYAEDKGDNWQFAVSDNGIGIKPEYLESIFAPFKRLHSDREYSGTGIGLAICKKIVEGWNGNIWAESNYGSGSTFFFTVPKRKEEPQS